MKQFTQTPRMSEKSLTFASRGWYTFVVDNKASKSEIARDISALYSVKVVDVRTVRIHPKQRRVGRTMRKVRTSIGKKALVRLSPGQKIDAFEVTNEEKK